jgi:hypothetical protein
VTTREVAAALREEALLEPISPVPAADPLADELPGERGVAVAAVREGWRLHGGGTPCVVEGADPGLALLAGDRLYALGLERLARAGDVEAVAVLARTIAACARASAEAAPERARAAWSEAVAEMAPKTP